MQLRWQGWECRCSRKGGVAIREAKLPSARPASQANEKGRLSAGRVQGRRAAGLGIEEV